ncbi:MAG: PIN domain-containing protein [Gammaproteobacteria bacterium]|nr:PIN domain-containing protein [Gammaproteobacteria bacterium]
MRVILDTNVIAAGLRSRQGASFQVIERLVSGDYEIALTLPLYLDYRNVLGRDQVLGGIYTQPEILDVCRSLTSLAHLQDVHYLWRPWLRNPKDDLVLEAALASGSSHIVTHNLRDFLNQGVEKGLGIQIVSPGDFLRNALGEKK